MESRYGKTEPNTKEIGGSIRPAVMANSGMSTEMFSRENGSMTRPTAMEFMSTRTVPGTKANGKTISNTAKERKFGQTTQCTRDITTKARSTVRAFISGKMDHPMTMTGTKIGSKE